MITFPDPGERKPLNEGLSRVCDSNSRDENTQRNGLVVHVAFVAAPVTPLIAISTAPAPSGDTLIASVLAPLAALAAASVWPLVCRYARRTQNGR